MDWDDVDADEFVVCVVCGEAEGVCESRGRHCGG